MTHDTRTRRAELFILCVLALALVSFSQFSVSFSQGPNNRNVSVDTFVNITSSQPEIRFVYIANPITLGAGSTTVITCNATIEDFNGFADIDTVNATFFHSSTAFNAAQDNNTLYRNTSCSPIAGQQSGDFANYTCSIGLRYYAVNGTWNCTIEANDSVSFEGQGSNITNVSALLALNVTTLIDYGNMAIADTSSNQEANVTNLGNVPMNVTVKGYGGILDDGWGFVCESGGNLTVDLQHYASNSTALYSEKQTLSSSLTQVNGLTVDKAENDTFSLNATYWQLYLDPLQNVFGICNGTIIFQAEQSGQP